MSDDVSLGEWRCASCGEIHRDLPALVIKAPSIWLHADEGERERDFELTTDTCIWRNEGFFVRCVLALPFVDREGSLEFGVWSSLSAEHFRRYMAASGSADRVDLGWMFGWFSNRLPAIPIPRTSNVMSIRGNEGRGRQLSWSLPSIHWPFSNERESSSRKRLPTRTNIWTSEH